MKRTDIYAAGVLFLLSAGQAAAQSSVALYGLIDTGITYVDKIAGSSQTFLHAGGLQASRFGFRGTEDLGHGSKALFVIEGGFNPANGRSTQGGALFGRRSVVGLSNTTLGTVFLGRQVDFLDDMSVFGSQINFGAQVAAIHRLDRVSAQRTTHSIRYNSPKFGGLEVGAIYGFGEQPGSLSFGQSFGFGAKYTSGRFRVGAAYYETKLGATSSDAGYAAIGAKPSPGTPGVTGADGDTALRVYALGTSYQLGPARLFALWTSVRQPLAVPGAARELGGYTNDRTDLIDAGVNYAVSSTLQLSASVIHSRVRFSGAPRGRLTQFNLGVDYFLSKRTDLYFLVGQLNASDMTSPGMGEGAPGGSDTQRLVRIGIRHKF